MSDAKRQRKFAGLLALAILCASLGYWLFSHRRHRDPEINATALSTEKESSSSPTNRGAVSPAPGTLRKSARPAEALAQAAEDKNVDITFWGRVVDGHNAPLPEVRIRGHIRHWQLVGLNDIGSRFIQKETVSGSDGRFEISGETGDVLTIEALQKDGYEPERLALRSFGYNISTNITPDRNNPVVLRMWRSEEKTDLITGDKHYWIVPDGRVYTINLIEDQQVESATTQGDLRIWIRRPEAAKFGERYDWSCGIQAPDGGLAEEPDSFSSMFIAPMEGYTNNCEFNVQASPVRWSPGLRKRFYLRTRNGQVFARLNLDLSSLYSPENSNGRLWLRYAVNSSGSRILRGP